VALHGDFHDAIGGAGLAGVLDDLLEGDAEAGGIRVEIREAGVASDLDRHAAICIKLEGGEEGLKEVLRGDLAPDGGGGGGEGLGAVHEIRGRIRALADAEEAVAGVAVEALVINEEADVSLTKA
jgi:hypothetical protein